MYIMFILSLCVALVACNNPARNYELNAQSFTAKNLKLVEQKTGIIMPAGSRGLNMYFDGFQIDPSLIAKIEIPDVASESVASQIEQIPIEHWTVQNPLIKKVRWWKPSKVTPRVERQFNRNSSGGFVEIQLCEEDGHWILYVQWYAV